MEKYFLLTKLAKCTLTLLSSGGKTVAQKEALNSA